MNPLANPNYASFNLSPDRIDGSLHNTAKARLGVGFNYSAMELLPAIEIAVSNEPYGNMRSLLVVDMEAAKALRDQLDAALKEHDANIRLARRNAAQARQAQREKLASMNK